MTVGRSDSPSVRPAFEVSAWTSNCSTAGGETLGKCVLQYDGTGVHAVEREGGTTTGTNSITSAGAIAGVLPGPARAVNGRKGARIVGPRTSSMTSAT